MWSPTHVQVTVQRAKGLLIKGKNGTNDCFVTIALGKEKYQTSVKYKASENVEWCEECDLQIPEQGNTAEVILKVLNQNFMGDNVLGQVSIPLAGLDVYESPRYRWHRLLGKPGKESTKNRGELEVKISFTVKEGSLTDLSKKEKYKSSFSSLAQNVGGSLLSIGSLEKKKGIKKFAKNLGSKMNLNKRDKKSDSSSVSGSIGNLKSVENSPISVETRQVVGEADPGVISEDDDEFAFDDLSHKSSGSSLNVHSSTLPRRSKYTPSPLNASLENLGGGELLRRSVSSGLSSSDKTPPSKPLRIGLEGLSPPQVPAHAMGQTDEWSQKLYGRTKSQSQIMIEKEKSNSLEKNKTLDSPSSLKEKPSPKFFNKKFSSKEKPKRILDERIIVGEEGIAEEESINAVYNNLPKEALKLFDNKTREDLVVTAWTLHKDMENEKKKVKDLENYLDQLLLRVMETTPRILQNPYSKANIHLRNKSLVYNHHL